MFIAALFILVQMDNPNAHQQWNEYMKYELFMQRKSHTKTMNKIQLHTTVWMNLADIC